MTLLASLIPLLADGSEFTFLVSKTATGLRVVTVPKLKDFQPDTTDPELAALQAALSQPLVFNLTDADAPDAELAALLAKAATVRGTTVDQLTAYRDSQRQAQQQAAAAAAAKKAEATKKTTTKTPAKAQASTTTDSAGDGEPAGEGITLSDVAASAPVSDSTTTEPAGQANTTKPETIELF